MRGDADHSRRRKLREALESGKSVTEAAKAAGYPRTAVYRIAKTDPVIRELVASGVKGKRGAKPRLAQKLAAASSSADLDTLARAYNQALLEVLRDKDHRDRVKAVDIAARICREGAVAAKPSPAAPKRRAVGTTEDLASKLGIRLA